MAIDKNDLEFVEMFIAWSDSEFANAASGEYCEEVKNKIEGVINRLLDQSSPKWQDMKNAPRDRTFFIAKCREIDDARYKHWSGRKFVIQHAGFTSSGFDLGWNLFPGFACSDEWFESWHPLP